MKVSETNDDDLIFIQLEQLSDQIAIERNKNLRVNCWCSPQVENSQQKFRSRKYGWSSKPRKEILDQVWGKKHTEFNNNLSKVNPMNRITKSKKNQKYDRHCVVKP